MRARWGLPLCESQSSVDENAQQLANTVDALSAEAAAAGGTSKVTLIGYSMGGAVIRSLLAGCPVPVAPYQTLLCRTWPARLIRSFSSIQISRDPGCSPSIRVSMRRH